MADGHRTSVTQDRQGPGLAEMTMCRKRQGSTVPSHAGPAIRRMSRVVDQSNVMQMYAHKISASRQSISVCSGQSVHSILDRKVHKLGNTYRMAPDPEQKFNASRVSKVMKAVLTSYLMGEKYDSTLTASLTKNVAEVIKDRVKDMGFSQRYKYVSLVSMGQRADQSGLSVSRCLWNTETDNFASAFYHKKDLFASATLYAVYFE